MSNGADRRRERSALPVARAAAVLITAGIGAASFLLSFAALRDLAVRAGIPSGLAWLWPLIIDGSILQATMAVVVLSRLPGQQASRRFFWVVLSCSAAVSVGANALHALLPPQASLSPWWTAAIAVVAPVSLLAATHGLSLLSTGALESGAPHRIRQAQKSHSGSENAETLVAAASADRPVTPAAFGGDNAQKPGNATSFDAVADPGATADPGAAQQLGLADPVRHTRWHPVAEEIAARELAGQLDEVTDIAAVLSMSFEQQLSHREIGRRLQASARSVAKVVAAGSELLASGAVSVARDETAAVG